MKWFPLIWASGEGIPMTMAGVNEPRQDAATAEETADFHVICMNPAVK